LVKSWIQEANHTQLRCTINLEYHTLIITHRIPENEPLQVWSIHHCELLYHTHPEEQALEALAAEVDALGHSAYDEREGLQLGAAGKHVPEVVFTHVAAQHVELLEVGKDVSATGSTGGIRERAGSKVESVERGATEDVGREPAERGASGDVGGAARQGWIVEEDEVLDARRGGAPNHLARAHRM
jgi:hypothetical protein